MGVFKRTVRTMAKRAKKYVKKRYGFNKKSSGMNLGTLASDVMLLKKMVNAEKKFFNKLYTKNTVSQAFGATGTGASCTDITPLIDQGLGPDGRTGASVKLCSALYQFQITQQSAIYAPMKIVIEFWKNTGLPLPASTLLSSVYANAQFSGVIDINSPRNQNTFSDYKLIRRVVKVLPGDQVATGDLQTITFDVPVKFNRGKGHHIRLVNSISGTPENDIFNGQIFMIMRGSIGNADTLSASTKDIPFTAINTGATVRFASKTWFYDN